MIRLNPQQQEAVHTIDWPLLINAGAGSGKTHTLTERVGYMIQEQGIEPRSILCVTFTNKAAKEMRERMARRLNVKDEDVNPFRNYELPLVGTFHSIASFFLRMFADRVWYGKDFVIYDSDDCLRLVKRIMKDQNINDKENNPRAILSQISKAKGDWYSPSEFLQKVDSYFLSIVADVYKSYAGIMKQENAVDFDDLLLLFRKSLDIGEVLEYFHDRFKYFLVDEYQDTNMLQYEIVKILASKTRNLCVVWDDWQGIYSWRWANIENIMSFQKDYPEAKVINLEENYRSTKNIIEAANCVIKNNANQMQKTLFSSRGNGQKITLLEGIDDKNEAELIATAIRDDKEAEDYRQFAILYRTNGQSRLLEEALIHKNIPYKVYGGVKFYERKEIKDILAYMRLIYNPMDRMSLRRIVNVPARKVGAKSLENLENVLDREHMSIADLAENDMILDSFSGIWAKWIQNFCTIYWQLRKIAKESSVQTLMEAVIKKTGYEAYLKEWLSEEEYEGKLDNLAEFLNMASRYDGMLYPENLAMFLEDIALITDQDRDQDNANDAGHVSLMTVHLAKGLEFPQVFIAGAEEGIFPHSRSLLESMALEEERRLMYVAITRAKEKLFITRARERYTFGDYSANSKSRFIKEIPEKYLDTSKQETRERSIFGTNRGGFWSFQNVQHSFASPIKKKVQSKPKNTPSDFDVGMQIKHPQYGIGTIVAKNESIWEIAFAGLWIKKMNLEIAPIQKV